MLVHTPQKKKITNYLYYIYILRIIYIIFSLQQSQREKNNNERSTLYFQYTNPISTYTISFYFLFRNPHYVRHLFYKALRIPFCFLGQMFEHYLRRVSSLLLLKLCHPSNLFVQNTPLTISIYTQIFIYSQNQLIDV